MASFEIRPLSKKDTPGIAALWKDLLVPCWTDKMIEESLSLSTTQAYGAFLSLEPSLKGFIMGSLVQEEAEIYGIAVQETFQGQGIGIALLTKFERTCKIQEGKAIFLEVAQNNAKAQKFYLSQGYILFAKRDAYYPNKEEARIFRKDLPCVRNK